jgi:hypothetical protein
VWQYVVSREGDGNRERKLSEGLGYNIETVVNVGAGEGKSYIQRG